MKIPYGLANFATIRREGYFYVDKTPFLPLLESRESGYSSLLFLRPRRMGKSALVSMMEHYYDLARADEFDALFGGLWIHEHPTPEKNRYLVLHLNFSTVSAEGDPQALTLHFSEVIKGAIRTLGMRYGHRIAPLATLYDEVKDYRDPAALMNNLIGIVAGTKDQIYLLIDEYDTFANDLLSSGLENLYSTVTGKMGFVRSFYRTLKAGTETGAIARIFVTGASPILLDDLYTGFNIATNISQHAQLATLAGFTRADVEQAVDALLRDRPDLGVLQGLAADVRDLDPSAASGSGRAALLDVLGRYYNGYRFSLQATEKVFNSDLVLFFLRELVSGRAIPRQMLDSNARTDYGKLHRLWVAAGLDAQERREALETVLETGHVWARLIEQFGRSGPSSFDQTISLLYYTGMLTLSDAPPSGNEVCFEIPNQVIRELGWEHFGKLLKQEKIVIARPPRA